MDTSDQLTTLVQIVQQQQQQIQSLLAQPSNPSPRLPQEPRVAPPEFFSGNRKNSRTFLLQLKNVFLAQPSSFSNETQRVSYAISYLRGSAFAWISPFLDQDKDLLHSFRLFETAFLTAFGDTDRKQCAETELLSLRQGNHPASQLVSDFQRLSMEVQWSEDALFSLFYKALSDDVKDEFCKLDRPAFIEDFYTLAIRIDNRIFARRREKQGQGYNSQKVDVRRKSHFDPHPPKINQPRDDPMVLGMATRATRGPLSSEEREHRKVNNLCMYCGTSGHVVADCSVRSKSKQTLGKAQARV
jgi:hypothetical protein